MSVIFGVGSERVAHVTPELGNGEPIIVLFRVDVEFAVICEESIAGGRRHLDAKLVLRLVRYPDKFATQVVRYPAA